MPPQSGDTEEQEEPILDFLQLFTWEEIAIHTGQGHGTSGQERWLVIDRKIYDVSKFYLRHPGGRQVISHYAGQDATVRTGKGGKHNSLVGYQSKWKPGCHGKTWEEVPALFASKFGKMTKSNERKWHDARDETIFLG